MQPFPSGIQRVCVNHFLLPPFLVLGLFLVDVWQVFGFGGKTALKYATHFDLLIFLYNLVMFLLCEILKCGL